MNYALIQDVIALVKDFEALSANPDADINMFKRWVAAECLNQQKLEPDWEGKADGRSPESMINTSIVHLNRYARTYSKSVIFGSPFSTQEDFIYLIVLKACGAMSKMELIKRNIQDKPVGMQIISRLLRQGWVEQRNSETDKRSKVVKITQKGIDTLEKQMDKIRQATSIVTGDLTYDEKMELIRLLNKLRDFHHPIYSQHLEPDMLLEEALKKKSVQTLN